MIRTGQREICISIDPDLGVAAPFKWKRERQGCGETERESECVCECRSTPEQHRSASTNNTLREGERERIEKHIANIFKRNNAAASLINQHDLLRSGSDVGSHDRPDNGLRYLVYDNSRQATLPYQRRQLHLQYWRHLRSSLTIVKICL